MTLPPIPENHSVDHGFTERNSVFIIIDSGECGEIDMIKYKRDTNYCGVIVGIILSQILLVAVLVYHHTSFFFTKKILFFI